MSRRYDAVIFDWAGTTVDYGSFAPVQAFAEAFQTYGITPTPRELREPMGLPKLEHIRAMFSMERISKLWEEKQGRCWEDEDAKRVYLLSEEIIMDILSDFSSPKPYVTETVKKLRDLGIKIGSTTGYTAKMMEIVVPKAASLGYAPDCWYCPDDVKGKGRPWPYMIFRNMEHLGLQDIGKVIKVGDTTADILEGRHAGMVTAGILEGSSVMGLSQEEYESLSEEEQERLCADAEQTYRDAGADYVIRDIRGILPILEGQA